MSATIRPQSPRSSPSTSTVQRMPVASCRFRRRTSGPNVLISGYSPSQPRLRTTRNDILAQGAPAEIELELIHDAGSGWVSAGVVAAGQLTAPVLLDDGNWRVLVDTSPGDADRGDPLMWNSERATGMSRLGPESESIVLRWPPGE